MTWWLRRNVANHSGLTVTNQRRENNSNFECRGVRFEHMTVAVTRTHAPIETHTDMARRRIAGGVVKTPKALGSPSIDRVTLRGGETA